VHKINKHPIHLRLIDDDHFACGKLVMAVHDTLLANLRYLPGEMVKACGDGSRIVTQVLA
jgi:hypothetical protein